MALATPGIAVADPVPSNLNIRKSVYAIELDDAVRSMESVRTEGDRVTVRISADVLFAFDKADLTAAARRRLSQLAPQLRQAVG
ncbi:hypothetical protein ACFQ07_11570, partial [Actinomadura adrarensis]